MKYSAIVIPLILLFMAAEYIAAILLKKKEYFKFENSISNLSIGIAERMMYLLFATMFYQVFEWIYINFAFLQVPSNALIWVVLLMLTDLLWYWYHRFGHEINFFWSAHIVHHQSEDFNFTVAARITFFQALIRNAFWCVLPLIGFHPDMVITILLVHGGYSFFTHTQMIPKLGFLEKIFITPSHHRVHHASNERYLDKNYGDIFVFWDKIFGTFQEEDEQPIYGLVKPLQSQSFLWQHFHFYFEMWEAMLMEKSWKEKIKILFGKPVMVNELASRRARFKYHRMTKVGKLSQFQKAYLVFQSAMGMGILFFFTMNFSQMDWVNVLLVFVIVLLTLINIGALLERKTWLYNMEIARLYFTFVWVIWVFNFDVELVILIVAFTLTLWSLPVKNFYQRLMMRSLG
jgi:alkylglycerol monooxygenase